MEENLMSIGTYVDPFVIKVLLCDSINNEVESILDYEQVKEYVKSLKINVTKEEVDAFLDKEFEKDCPEVRTRIKNDNYSHIIENICDLRKYVDSANNFNSYLHVNINKNLIYLSGENYDDLFPSRKLQVNDLLYDKSLRGYVPLTDKQKQDIIVKNRKNYEYVLKLTDDLK